MIKPEVSIYEKNSSHFSPTGSFLATGREDDSCHVREVVTGREVAKLLVSPNGEWITSIPGGFYINSRKGKI
jgi:hypothetical protein